MKQVGGQPSFETILRLRIFYDNPSGSSPVWGMVPERGVLKGEASNLRGANLMMFKGGRKKLLSGNVGYWVGPPLWKKSAM